MTETSWRMSSVALPLPMLIKRRLTTFDFIYESFFSRKSLMQMAPQFYRTYWNTVSGDRAPHYNGPNSLYQHRRPGSNGNEQYKNCTSEPTATVSSTHLRTGLTQLIRIGNGNGESIQPPGTYINGADAAGPADDQS